ncbi:amidohydrolase [Cellulomonas fimi]|uniref:Amidohydrolase n=1 Tax=Cellulomonas fimi (strain ATCC 484 / DSM 20113 / JCM 1341 / CCUG 24087 / LMG 16345 / NBRC 15513 / NCIMB 8980 / NCTC 7547 / NRS-133) TaxID=590998 RepID=F4H4Z4_CELFA|nr:amidohydrolase [Cellulomonas fimi]AEE45474.1 amidohydrolase [Cellulomonas fimi ATCC 484]NNH07300.1 amidohydrolase [Cellulomonas fimi]VEH29524.1 Atrazine chlorohydrolase [Cellulomonas fimi]
MTSPTPSSSPALDRTVAIRGGYVVPVSAPPIEDGTVLVVDGRIAAVGGPEVEVPAGARVVDATGRWVLPGFVDGHAHVGLHEEGEGSAGNDTNEMVTPNTAGVRAVDAVNIEDEGFRDALAGGVTAVVVKPGSGNPVGGQSVAMKTWGGRTVDEQVISASVSVKSALGENPKRVYGERKQLPSTRLGTALVIREAFTKARHYAAARAAAATKGEPFATDLALETLARVLDGELLWDQHTHRHDDIATALRLADEFGYRLVVNHGTEAHKIADVLAERDVPVIFGPMLTSRSKVELRDRAVANLAAIAAAGVRVAITTDHPVVPINFLVHQATLAVKEGLPRQTALEALTTNPAAFYGLDERIGALEVGRDGDVVVWSGDPLDVHARAEHVLVAGRTVYTWDTEAHRGRVVERAERFTR